MRIYLGGPINACSDSECKDWRAEARAALKGHEIVDPMSRDYRGKEAESVSAIVEGDKSDIDGCDLLIMNCPKPSVGTSMEVLYGWEGGKSIIVIAPEPVSPWLRYHATLVVSSLREALAAAT